MKATTLDGIRRRRGPRPPGIPGFIGGDPRADYVRAFGIAEVVAVELGADHAAFLKWGATTGTRAPTTLRRLDDLAHRFRCHQATLAAVAALDAEIAGGEPRTEIPTDPVAKIGGDR